MKTCKVDGCDGKVRTRGYCNRHYLQMSRHGEILERTWHDPNEFIIEGDIVRIVLYNEDGIPHGEAIVDKEDLSLVSRYKWHLYKKPDKESNSMYCASKPNNKTVYLHKLLMRGAEADHIDRNGLNCRRSNLREVSHQQNCFNIGPRVNSKTGIKGVSRNGEKWLVQIMRDGINRNLGRFDSIREATLVYNEAAKELFGDFAYLNPVQEVDA